MSNTAPSVTPERILQFVWAFAPPLAIEAAIRHRVFDVLAKQPMSIAELAQATGASTRGLSAIADLLVGFALLTRDDEGRYALTPESDAFLVSHKPSFMGGIFRHMSSQLLPNWLHLSDIVGSGKPATAVNSIAEGAPFFAEFVEDILPLSYPSAHMLADALNLAQATGPVSVLDLASGSGVWGIALAQASPHVTVHAVDWPDVLPVTRRVAERFGVGERFTTGGRRSAASGFRRPASGGDAGPYPSQRRSRTLPRAAATDPRRAGAGRHDRDRRIPGGRGSPRPDERADLRGEHAGQHRARKHLFVRRDRRLVDRGRVHQSASVARPRPFAVDPRDARLTSAFAARLPFGSD